MEAANIEQLYEEQIKPLPVAQQLRLVEPIAREMAVATVSEPKRSLLELEGLGAEIRRSSLCAYSPVYVGLSGDRNLLPIRREVRRDAVLFVRRDADFFTSVQPSFSRSQSMRE